MNVRNLFMKIFLWFWLANTVVIAAQALAMWMYPHVWMPGPLVFDHEQAERIRRIFELLDQRKTAEFEKTANYSNQIGMFRTFWLDEQGRELIGQIVPDRLLKYAEQQRDQVLRGESAMTGPPFGYIVVPLTDSQGHRYRALAEVKGRGEGRGVTPPPEQSYFRLVAEPQVLAPRLIAVVLAAGLGCYALARYLTSPVRKLQHAARQLAAGDLSARVGKNLGARRDEIGELGRDFDRMAQQVESLVNTQNRLLRDVSHELRSPLARLNVALELAGRDAGTGAAPALNRAAREADRLNELIGQLLTLARLEGGSMQPAQTQVDLKGLVAQIAADADFEAAAHDRHVKVIRCDDCTTIGSPELLHSAIENVMRNAIRYTANGTDVEVSLINDGNALAPSAHLEIRDHGPGVPEEALQDIFKPFHRVSGARDRQSGGTGLGLAITERAIQLHSGWIRARNAAGGGLAVQIELPCSDGKPI